MRRIFVPARNGSDWQLLLAKPDLHWKVGKSAMTAAACWDAAGDRLPPDVMATLEGSAQPAISNLKLLAAIPEWEVPLPGGSRSSFTDVLAITSNDAGLCTLAVEAKAGEDFGPTLKERLAEPSQGQSIRIRWLQELLGAEFGDHIRYQLLHRTASALLIARDFHAQTAVMLVHAWRSTPEQRADFEAFASAIGARACTESVKVVDAHASPRLYLAWTDGDPSFLSVKLASGI